VSLCGDMAGDPALRPRFCWGLVLRSLSVAPAALAGVKAAIARYRSEASEEGALGMKIAASPAMADNTAVADYKRILQQVAGASAGWKPASVWPNGLGKNRSFISQITNAKYSVPIPANHLESIFESCHLLPAERESFMTAYRRAHPHRAPKSGGGTHWRELRLRVPDLRDQRKNKELDALLHENAAQSSTTPARALKPKKRAARKKAS